MREAFSVEGGLEMRLFVVFDPEKGFLPDAIQAETRERAIEEAKRLYPNRRIYVRELVQEVRA